MTEPNWARGYPMAELKERAAVFAEAFRQHCYGAFGLPKENAIADALAADECIWTRAGRNSVQAVALAKRLRSASRQIDFAGRIYSPRTGDLMVRAIAGTDDGRKRVLAALAGQGARAIWIEDFIEAEHSALWGQLGFDLAGVKIMASSDIKGLWHRGDRSGRFPARNLTAADRPALATLDSAWLDQASIDAILAEVDRYGQISGVAPWAQHYSSYNKRQSWTAFALQGFDPDDPGFIIKPAEMSKAWRADNPQRLSARCLPTIAAEHFPQALKIVARLPGQAQRIRLMRLASGNGELSRHADITDPECGTANGATARIHIPLQSPAECRFLGWGIDGRKIDRRFAPGGLYYLDTRKPHSVINPGKADRIHLVVDLHSGPELRRMIEAAS